MKDSMEIELFDIYEYLYTPFWKTNWFICIFIMMMACIAFGLFWYFKWHAKKIDIADKILIDLSLISLDEMDSKEFYFLLTERFKIYLQDRYNRNFVSKTDAEIITFLKQYQLDFELIESAKAIFMGPQLVKFANHQAALDQMALDLEACKIFILKTRVQQGGLDTSGTLI